MNHLLHRPYALLDSAALVVGQLAAREDSNILKGDQQVAPAIGQG